MGGRRDAARVQGSSARHPRGRGWSSPPGARSGCRPRFRRRFDAKGVSHPDLPSGESLGARLALRARQCNAGSPRSRRARTRRCARCMAPRRGRGLLTRASSLASAAACHVAVGDRVRRTFCDRVRSESTNPLLHGTVRLAAQAHEARSGHHLPRSRHPCHVPYTQPRGPWAVAPGCRDKTRWIDRAASLGARLRSTIRPIVSPAAARTASRWLDDQGLVLRCRCVCRHDVRRCSIADSQGDGATDTGTVNAASSTRPLRWNCIQRR